MPFNLHFAVIYLVLTTIISLGARLAEWRLAFAS